MLAAIDRGAPRREVVQTFGVSLATLKRWLKKQGVGVSIATMSRAIRNKLG